MIFIGNKEDLLRGQKVGQVAAKLDISRNYLSLILNCKRTCSIRLAKAITKLIDKEINLKKYFANNVEK